MALEHGEDPPSGWSGRAALAGAAAAAVSALAAAASGPGCRLGLWDFRAGFSILRWAAYGGLASFALCACALLSGERAPDGSRSNLLAAAMLGALVFILPWRLYRSARSFPPIHDITTDTADPPAFAAVLPLRRGVPNAPDHGGPAVAALQRGAYPGLEPLELSLAPAEALVASVRAARTLGWEIVAAVPAEGRIEATDTTFWFGFKDDIVVRVRASAGGSRVDVRSLSRVGKGDAGANARRIRRFLTALRDAPRS